MTCLVAQSCPTFFDPHGLWPARLCCSRDYPGKITGVGCHFLLQELFLTQEWNLHLLHCRWSLLLNHPGSCNNPPIDTETVDFTHTTEFFLTYSITKFQTFVTKLILNFKEILRKGGSCFLPLLF